MSTFDSALNPEQIGAVKDEDLDFSEIPELDETFWQQARLVEPDRTEQISLRIRRSVIQWFKRPGKGYQTRINRVLETYVQAQRDAERREDSVPGHHGGRWPGDGADAALRQRLSRIRTSAPIDPGGPQVARTASVL